jgi:hypothetical protein
MNFSKEQIIKLINYYYRCDNPTGGNLHIILDDHNFSLDSFDFCEELCRKDKDYLGLLLIDILIGMNEAELESLIVL